MHPLTSGLALYSPSSRSESSFPERHLDLRDSDWPTHDDMTNFSNIDLNFSQSAIPKAHTFDQSFWSQSWLTQTQPVLDRNHITPIEHPPPILPTSFRPPITTSPVQTEWDLFRAASAHSPGGLQWDIPNQKQSPEDDSDSINDSLEEFCPPLSTWTTTHRVRRRSTHRITKPSRLPTTQSLHVGTSSKRHVNSHSPDVLDFSDAHIMFNAQPDQDNIMLSPDIAAADFTFQDGPLSSKLQEKRVAHKLSEKSRRNRLTVAIREIQKLLPSEIDREGDSPQQQQEIDILVRPGVPSSKLDVVEMAIGFIRKLKEENAEMAKRLTELEKQQSHDKGGKTEGGPPGSEKDTMAE
ncbi:hypothetical protein QBC38DRAFT_136032 [Podospora fimiseda]|uniref:BHLH domain-containing protein n=1 Tax=Podospora fimiseda TaxID=252190 RepID=A0AAN7H1Q5_9PEZI|nr:hypothetical protein QBC38DRAFT_136032 [Podospora fimiseda]